MKTDFNLSEKVWRTSKLAKRMDDAIPLKYVKEFITTIQVKVLTDWKGQNEFIDWLDKKVGGS